MDNTHTTLYTHAHIYTHGSNVYFQKQTYSNEFILYIFKIIHISSLLNDPLLKTSQICHLRDSSHIWHLKGDKGEAY